MIELPSGARQRKRRIFEDICNSDQNQHQHQDQNHQMRMAANSESELRRRRGAGKEKPPVVEREKKKIPASDLKVLTQSSVIKICVHENTVSTYFFQLMIDNFVSFYKS